MTQSLEALKSGKLLGAKRVKIACGLEKFPEELISLADTLEILDLSDNNLTTLPDSITKLKHLKIVFFARNQFKEYPSILHKCEAITMIGFKSNQITSIPEKAFPPLLQWLILTDNKIQEIPKTIGDCKKKKKCALAGNQITTLPTEMSSCRNLELLRISANKIQELPTWLFELPRLSWVAFGGNFIFNGSKINNGESFDWDDFEIKEQLGEGASGFISRATWKSKNKDIAIKIFKGEVTSDGLPEDEMDIAMTAGSHHNLIDILGKINNHPTGTPVLLMELISTDYVNLGLPPTFETCTRDVFEDNLNLNQDRLLTIAKDITSVCLQLHSKGINHGDLYAHNILINTQGHCILGDFGAATFYDTQSRAAEHIEKTEVRALACLLEDLLNLVDKQHKTKSSYTDWGNLIASCMNTEVSLRPSFRKLTNELNQF